MYNAIINAVFDAYAHYKLLVDMHDNIYPVRISAFIEVKLCWSYNLC